MDNVWIGGAGTAGARKAMVGTAGVEMDTTTGVLVLLGSTNIQGPTTGPTKYLIAAYAGPQYTH